MKSKLERRFLKQEFRVSGENEPAKIFGYGALVDSPVDMWYWTEEIDPHAFDTVMSTNPDVRALFNHDPNLVLGRTTANTLQLTVDARGLAYEIDPPDTQFSRDLMVSMRRKDITQSSFAFVVKRDQWTDNPDESITRRILEIEELWDVSPVTYPANPKASAALRSLPVSMPAETRARVERRMAGDNDCECDCAECNSGDCQHCTHENCDCDGCNCPQSRSVPVAAAPDPWRGRAEMRLALAQHSA